MSKFLAILFFLPAGILAVPVTAHAAGRQDIWFTASPRAATGLYAPDAPWQDAAAHIAVMKIYASHLHEAKDDELRRFLAFLAARHIKLALEFGPLNADGSCGPTEGFGGAHMAAEMAARIARLGGTISYVAMDEPYWFGHVYNGPRACHWSAQDIARNMQPTLAAFRAAFPRVVFGDIEPVNTRTGDLIAQYAAWIALWQQTAGAKPGFFHADVDWSPAGTRQLAAFGNMLATARIRFGVIYNGDAGDDSDAAWLDKATSRFENFEAGENPLPDDVVFQSWNPFPQRLLPDSDKAAFTHLILSYLRIRTTLSATAGADDITGGLRGADARPLPQAPLLLEMPAATGTRMMDLTGLTPPGTAAALIGWRANTECGCDGVADLRINTVTMQLGDVTIHPNTGSDGILHVAATQQLKLNSPAFPASGNAPFRLTLSETVTGPTTDSAYGDLIFLNTAGREIGRVGVSLAPPWTIIGQALTGKNGDFNLILPHLPAGTALRVVFAGNAADRAAQTTLDVSANGP